MICYLREQVTLQVAESLGREWNSVGQARVKISFGASGLSAYPSLASPPLLHFLISGPQRTPFALPPSIRLGFLQI